MHRWRLPRMAAVVAAIAISSGIVTFAHAQEPDTLWRPETGVAMLVWDSVIPMAPPGEPADTVALPFGNLATFRVAGGADVARVLRDGSELPPIGSGGDHFALWFEVVRVGEVAHFEACIPGVGGDSCWAVALRRPAAPEIVVVGPRATVTDPTYRHSGEAVAGGGAQLAHGRGAPADTIDVGSGERLEVRVSPTPDSVWASVLPGSEPWPASPSARPSRVPPGLTWMPGLPDGATGEWLVCAWWGERTHECRVVGLRGVSLRGVARPGAALPR